MKSIIIYYSYTGNTRCVAQALASYLKSKNEVEVVELKSLDENSNFFRQAKRAFIRAKAKLDLTHTDLSSYEMVCLGTPVWAFRPTPAMNAYLNECKGLEGKAVALFTTSGGMGDEGCINYMQEMLIKKGAKTFRKFSIPQGKVRDSEFILSKIKDAMPLSPNG